MFNTNITIKDVQAIFTQEEINNFVEKIENNKRIAIEKEKESFSSYIAQAIEDNKSTKKIENEEEMQEWEAELLRQSMC